MTDELWEKIEVISKERDEYFPEVRVFAQALIELREEIQKGREIVAVHLDNNVA
jgi:hypothetical protein